MRGPAIVHNETPHPLPVNMNGKPLDTLNINQLDGNDSISTSFSESENSVIIPPNQASDKISAAAHLPTVATYNMLSLFQKVRNVTTDILERRITVGFFSETWKNQRINHIN